MDVSIPYETFTLDNGLRVTVHEDRTLPLVAVNLWYRVGSKDERPGRTGLAHLFEHLMFEGSQHAPAGSFDDLLESAGGVNNGSTTTDRTNYYEIVPSSALDLALWLEADRMGWLLPALSREKLDGQRDVVKNERRQSYENRPYGLAFETLLTMLYPPDHPYHWPVIGSMEDLDAATLDDVHAFFRTYYAPNNATLAVAGAVDAAALRARVETYFGEIPRGPAPRVVQATAPAPDRESRRILEDDVQLPRLYLAWHSPPFLAEGDAALDAAAAILGEGKASRLHRTLVHERRIAQSVTAYQHGGRLGSLFVIVATARPDAPLGPLEAAVRAELQALARHGPAPAELDRARNRVATAFVDGLQDVSGRADRLNLYTYYADDPGYAAHDLARYLRLSPRDVADALRRYTIDAPAAVLSVVPVDRPDLAAEPGP